MNRTRIQLCEVCHLRPAVYRAKMPRSTGSRTWDGAGRPVPFLVCQTCKPDPLLTPTNRGRWAALLGVVALVVVLVVVL